MKSLDFKLIIVLIIGLFWILVPQSIAAQDIKQDSVKIEDKEVEKDDDMEEEEDDDMEEDDDDDDENEEEEDKDWDMEWNGKNGGKGKMSFRFSLLDIGFNSYLYNNAFELPKDLDNLDLLYGGSLNLNWHLFRHRLPIVGKKVGIEYGLTMSWMQYKFANNFTIQEDTTSFFTIPLEGEFKKNKLRTTFLEVPVMLTITPGRRKSYFISGGLYGGVLLGSSQKLKDEEGNKYKYKDDYNLNKFRYGVEGRIGLGPVSFYAQYSLTTLFKENQGPELYPINIGVTLINY